MKTISGRVDEYIKRERTTSGFIDSEVALSQAVAAAKMYSGWAVMETFQDSDGVSPEVIPEVTADTEISQSEWTIIRQLFLLYLEKEEAFELESARSMGVELFGRSSSEVVQEISLFETEKLPKLAFSVGVNTI